MSSSLGKKAQAKQHWFSSLMALNWKLHQSQLLLFSFLMQSWNRIKRKNRQISTSWEEEETWSIWFKFLLMRNDLIKQYLLFASTYQNRDPHCIIFSTGWMLWEKLKPHFIQSFRLQILNKLLKLRKQWTKNGRGMKTQEEYMLCKFR